jgi:hypothetical protein
MLGGVLWGLSLVFGIVINIESETLKVRAGGFEDAYTGIDDCGFSGESTAHFQIDSSGVFTKLGDIRHKDPKKFRGPLDGNGPI